MTEPVRAARVVLVRHGPAEDRDPVRWPDDRARPLSRKGVAETRRAAAGLAGLVGRVDAIATSPAARARRTAELLRVSVRAAPRLVDWPELDLDEEAAAIFPPLRGVAGPGRTVVLVGHEPTLAGLVGLALTGEAVEFAHLGKAGAALLEFPSSIRPGAARLGWLLTRKQLARLAE